MLFRVDRYGWTWLATAPRNMAAKLVETWASGAATEVRVAVPGRREVTV
jgi:hypothetical protein